MKRFLCSLALAFGALSFGMLSGCGAGSPAPVGGTGGAGGGTAGTGGTGGSTGGTGGTVVDAGSGGSGGGGTGGGSGGQPGDGGADAPGGETGPPGPTLLSQTGLYSNTASGMLAAGVHPFQPQYQLWSDGATKKRWVALPAGTKIDTSDMDFWDYPNGTKLWKEFSRDGKRVETRLLQKRSPGDWFMMAYKWNDQQTDAAEVPLGEANASGTQHDIPSKENCGTCHNAMQDFVLGFTAIQLSHALPGSLNLDMVKAMNWLTAPPAAQFTLPGDAVDKAALGYLHANCGMCHNERSKIFTVKVDLDVWNHTNMLASVVTTRAYLSMVCDQFSKSNFVTTCEAGHTGGKPNTADIHGPGVINRVTPGSTATSSVYELMSLRGTAVSMRQMPPVGTAEVDTVGLKMVGDWITRLRP